MRRHRFDPGDAVTGGLAARIGAKPIVVAGGLGPLAVLPVLPAVHSPWTLAPALLWFGASLGTVDVALNVQAVEVERLAARPLMSGFHVFSVAMTAGRLPGDGLVARLGGGRVLRWGGLMTVAGIVALVPLLAGRAAAGQRARPQSLV